MESFAGAAQMTDKGRLFLSLQAMGCCMPAGLCLDAMDAAVVLLTFSCFWSAGNRRMTHPPEERLGPFFLSLQVFPLRLPMDAPVFL